MESIDIARCLGAMEKITVTGSVTNDGRKGLIEEAIAVIQKDGEKAMTKTFLGFKNYASFGDQRCDCGYGMGPRHGSIVFRIGRASRNSKQILGIDEVYLLECIRDFGNMKIVEYSEHQRRDVEKNLNLCDVLQRRTKYEKMFSRFDRAIQVAQVDRHDMGVQS